MVDGQSLHVYQAIIYQNKETRYYLTLGYFEAFHFTENQKDFLDKAIEEIQKIIQTIFLEKQIETERAKSLQSSKLAALGEMAGGLAHEINNPLAILLGYSSRLEKLLEKNQINDPKLNEIPSKINAVIDRVSAIIKGLRIFSRDASQDLAEKVKLRDLIDETLVFCSSKFKVNSIKMEVVLKEQDLEVLCQRVQMSQVLLNLLNNSFDAIQNLSDKWIRIEASQENEKILLKIVDSGNGIALENIDKIMNPFFTTKEIGEGTGLGLSISRGIIEAHNGSLYVDTSNPNTCFVIELPMNTKRSVA